MQATPSRTVTVGVIITFLLLQVLAGLTTVPRELSDSTSVRFQQSSLDYLEIIGPDRIVHADESVPLDLRWHDRNGNNESVLLPLENWTAESGNFIINGDHVEWLPGLEGTWEISAHAEDVVDTIEITVVNGTISHVWIDAEHEVLSADDEVSLVLQAEDSRGNRWPISAEWSILESEGSGSIVTDDDGTRFIGGTAGEWTIHAVHHRNEGDMNTSLGIEVLPGRLARIALSGDGTTVSADDAVNLNPILTDADDNLIENVQLNWTIDGINRTQEIQMAGNIWMPINSGDHLIEADAAGRSARARIHVVQGAPHQIIIETNLGNTQMVPSGEYFQISTFAQDLDGNMEPWGVEWELPNDSLEIQETSWEGVYDVRGVRIGTWVIEASNGTAWGNTTLEVLIGEPTSLRIGPHSGEGSQGDTYSLTVELVDFGGNTLPMQQTQVKFETGIGSVSHEDGPHWKLHLEEFGESQLLTVRYDDLTAETWIDVEPTGLDRLAGTQTGQMLIGGFAVAILFVALLFYIVRRNSVSEEHWDDEYEWIESQSDVEESTEVVDSIPNSSMPSTRSRRHRRRLSHQRQQQRIQAMEMATEEMTSTPPAAKVEASSGVLQAMDGTIQGQTGWYQTAQGEAQYWQVDASGNWSKVG
ncbi:MAG: hypothetical protein VX627_06965 [Candidatus Thermoplasmatota archaeon]|nr:hypothetical protein [Candidatus Thermoplasmatota archaeon]